MASYEWAKVQAGYGASFGGVTVTTAATIIGGTLPGRTSMTIWNNGAIVIYIGLGPSAGTVTSTTGFPIPAGGNVQMDLGPGVLVYAITASGSSDTRWIEAF
jgi:hypothetical protein